MRSEQPSRRSLLWGLLAALCGWCWPAKARAAAPPPAPVRHEYEVTGATIHVCTHIYDSEGRLQAEIQGPGSVNATARYRYGWPGRRGGAADE